MVGGKDDSEVGRRHEARRLLRQFLRYSDTFPRVRSEYVRCAVCDELVSIADVEPLHDETGEFFGWECEVHI